MKPESDDRDLSFHPVNNPMPKRLTAEQIQHYNEKGYIKPIRIFDDAEVLRNRDYFDWLLAEMMRHNDGRDSYAINGFHVRCAGLWDIVTHPLILDYVQDIVGPDIIAWGTHFFCKLPGDPKSVPWHQDASYWPFTPARTTTVWLAIDDADPENSAMQFIPGTHRMGHLNWNETSRPSVLNQEIENAEQYGKPVYDSLKAGEISIHADMLAHGSSPNHSSRRRCGLTIRYCPPIVQAVNAPHWNSISVLCRGSDTTGNWANVPRPSGEDMSIANRPKAIGGN